MEVHGRRENSSRDSAKQAEVFCQPCYNDAQQVEAEGFCQNCKEYLCSTCITYHRKVTLSRNHVILNKRNIPSHVHQKVATPVCRELCEKHASEVVKFYCKQHEAVGCGDCMVLDHKQCKVDYIPDIADEFLGGNEYKALVQEITRLQFTVKSKNEEIVRSEKEADKTYLETVNEIKTFRKKVNDYLDRMEQQLLNSCDKIKQENKSIIKKMDEDFKMIEKELDTIHTQITSKSDPSTDMFVKARKASSTVKTLDGQLSAAERSSKLKFCQLKRNEAINEEISKCCPLGEIEVRNTTQLQRKARKIRGIVNAIPKRERSINVKSSSERQDSCITSIIALNDITLACTDWFNNKVKLIDTTRGILSSEIEVEPKPWNLTLVSNKEIAVTLFTAQKIQFMSFKQGLSNVRSINVNGKCRGITYSKDSLLVSYEGVPKVEILTLQGKVLYIIENDNIGSPLFGQPLYVAVSNDEKFIYVSDSSANSVIKLTIDGQVLSTYKGPDSVDPRQLVVCEDGYLMVCSFSRSNVHLVSPEGKKLKSFLQKKDGLDKCMALCYAEDTGMVYLSNYNDKNQIQIYKMA